LGTDDTTLIRVMVSRSEIDMMQIKTSFKNMYGKTLASFISVSRIHHSFNSPPPDNKCFL